MTEKDFQGNITIAANALRQDLKVTEIRTGCMSEMAWAALNEIHRQLFTVGNSLLCFSDASDDTLRTIAEADEIIVNLTARISAEEPSTTARERHGKNSPEAL